MESTHTSAIDAPEGAGRYPGPVDARPLTARGEATRQRLVRAAVDAISEHGVAGLSLDRVLASAGASKGQLYHYFAGRDALLLAAVHETGVDVLTRQDELMGDLSDWDAIARWFDCLVELQVSGDSRGGCPLASLTGALADRDEAARDLLVEAFDAWEARLARGLSTMRDAGLLDRASDPDQLATATMAAVQGGLVLTQVRRDPTQLRIALDAAMSHLRNHTAR